MTLPRVLVLVLAGGAGGRLELLTQHRAKAAVPFARVYRLIDFPLSNCQHAQLPDVWVSAQFHPVSLAEHAEAPAATSASAVLACRSQLA
jgi:glucose-1-phosphate adenylyltransferase